MSSKASTVSTTNGVMALLVVVCCLVIGYAFFLEQTHRALDYQASFLEPTWYTFKPKFAVQMVVEGGFQGTLVAVAVSSLNAMVLAGIAFSFCLVLLPLLPIWKSTESVQLDAAADRSLLTCEIPGSQMLISIPGVDSTDCSPEAAKGIFDSSPFNETYMRVERADLALKRAPANPIESLYVAVYSILQAHSDVPASLTAHHSDASLFDHSKGIVNLLADHYVRMGWTDPLLKVAALAHDLDKLLAYKRTDTGWIKRATHHNTYSAHLVKSLPEFGHLDPDDQFTLVMALRYYHRPDQLPLNATDRVEHLIQGLRRADGQALRSEVADGVETVAASSETATMIRDALVQMFTVLDVNRYRGGAIPQGWTVNALEFVVVLASTLVEQLGTHLPESMSRQLQLQIDTRRSNHPALPVIIGVLDSMGLLMRSYKDHNSPNGLFDCYMGTHTFKACLLIDKEELRKLIPGTVMKWGVSPYQIKVRRPHTPPEAKMSDAADTDTDESPAEEA